MAMQHRRLHDGYRRQPYKLSFLACSRNFLLAVPFLTIFDLAFFFGLPCIITCFAAEFLHFRFFNLFVQFPVILDGWLNEVFVDAAFAFDSIVMEH